MSIPAVSGSAAGVEVDRATLVLKKQQDVQKAQAQALIQLVQQATDGTGRIVDVRA